MKIAIIGSVLLLTASLVASATFDMSMFKKCVDPETNELRDLDTSWDGADCTKYTCTIDKESDENTMSIVVTKRSCAAPTHKNGCYDLPGDENKSFPECCPSKVCIETQ